MRIKAASPDNHRETEQLVALFRKVYGNTFPIASVYDVQFWRTHISSRFRSLLVVDDRGDVRAHLAVQPDPYDPAVVQIVFPLCDPGLAGMIDQVGRELWNTVEVQADRQQWKALSFPVFPHIEPMMRFAEQVAETLPVAFCTGYFPATKLRMRGTYLSRSERRSSEHSRHDLIIMFKMFGKTAHERRKVFVPAQYEPMVTSLYSSLGLERLLQTRVAPHATSHAALFADRPAIDTHYFSRTQVVHAFLEPALITDLSNIEARYAALATASILSFIPAEDSGALAVIGAHEAMGFEFSGVFPLFRGRDSVLMMRPVTARGAQKSLAPLRKLSLIDYVAHA